MIDDSVHHGIVREEGNDAHPALAFGADKRVHLIHLPDHLSPAVVRDYGVFLLEDD